MPEANGRDRPAGEGNSRTARVHVFEESDSGTVPMNHSNKSRKPQAESEEGRPLIKENIHQASTLSTQSEVRVSQGLAGVRRAAREKKEMKFTARNQGMERASHADAVAFNPEWLARSPYER